eukprot:scaffold66643_cov26-Phaeocystis_antarctica.AAC.1
MECQPTWQAKMRKDFGSALPYQVMSAQIEAALREVAGSYGTTHPVYHDSASGSHSWAAWITRRRPPVPPYAQ